VPHCATGRLGPTNHACLFTLMGNIMEAILEDAINGEKGAQFRSVLDIGTNASCNSWRVLIELSLVRSLWPSGCGAVAAVHRRLSEASRGRQVADVEHDRPDFFVAQNTF
jgi:hypothetical protein